MTEHFPSIKSEKNPERRKLRSHATNLHLTSRRTEDVKTIMKLNLNIKNIKGANVVHGQRISHSILAPIFGRLRNSPFLRVGGRGVLHFGRRACDGLDDHSSHIGTDEDGVDDDSSHIETDEGRPARPFNPFRDLDLHASERPVPDDNQPFRYTGASAFKNKDWHKG